jgi:3-hydroxypropanoate dehydrogenase
VDLTTPEPTVEQAVALKLLRALDEDALRTIFLEARSANSFLPTPVARETLERVLEIALLGPTSANSLPGRFVFVESKAAKEKLKPALSAGNVDKSMAAPVTVIFAADLQFYDGFARTFPSRPEIGDRFRAPENAAMAREFARDNAILQMAYFIVAARAVGLDCGPMGGFDRTVVDQAFFADGRSISLYLMNVGYADGKNVFPRLPRYRPDEIAAFV